jgi:hypothetical protein
MMVAVLGATSRLFPGPEAAGPPQPIPTTELITAKRARQYAAAARLVRRTRSRRRVIDA